ncbi:hypothetical protein QFC19_003550 [Naganishia cerealis]|uniref:Uncharacterized protein n=1 Tax=Naganishia cerealis TaxID=610337 RepID=A0ACC2W2A0_9TREE|nr:hypothetical protein QFC19_003550 [Naganishia cerealis]
MDAQDQYHEEEEDEFINPDDVEYVEDEEEGADVPMDEDDSDGEGEDEDEGEMREPPEDNSLGHSGGEDDHAYIFCPLPPMPAPESNDPAGAADDDDDGQARYDPAYPFHSESFAPILLSGHTDSVVAVQFSRDGEMVATGGMDGSVRIWRRRRSGGSSRAGEGEAAKVEDWRDWEFLTSLTTDSEIMWIDWHPKGPVLAAGCQDGTVWMWQLPSGNTMATFYSHTAAVTRGQFLPNGKHLITASEDCSVCLWNPSASTQPIIKLTPSSTTNFGNFGGEAEGGGITALAVAPASNLCAIGGSNGAIRIVNLPQGNVVGMFKGHTKDESVEGLAFMDILGLAGPGPKGEAPSSTKGLLLVSCATDGKAIVWDVTTGTARVEVTHDDVITSVTPHPAPNRHLFTTASADTKLKTWDARQGQLVATHEGHVGTVLDSKVGRSTPGWGLEEDKRAGDVKGGSVVVSAGDDGGVLTLMSGGSSTSYPAPDPNHLTFMYLRPVHAEHHVPTLRALIERVQLGVLVTALPGPTGTPSLQSSHIPWVLEVDEADSETDHGVLKGHMALANPQAKALVACAQEQDGWQVQHQVMVLFTGHDHYISPQFYTDTKPKTGKVVPTWNYESVAAYGKARIYHPRGHPETSQFLDAQITRLTEQAETTQTRLPTCWKVSDAPSTYVDRLKGAIIGLEIRIERLEGKWKMSQEIGEEDRQGVVEGLQAEGDEGEIVARIVQDRGKGKAR